MVWQVVGTLRILRPGMDKPYLDEYQREYRKRQLAAEFQEIVSSVIYDGIVTDDEIRMLQGWLARHVEEVGIQQATELQSLLKEITEDNLVTADERKRLFDFLESLYARGSVDSGLEQVFTENPQVVFQGKVFMFTGEPKSASREKVMTVIRQRGGIVDVSSEFTPRVDYLIVGELGSEAMRQKMYGAKVARALRLRAAGKSKVQILRERDFIEAVMNG